jgi:hypothetical protein
LNKSSESGHPCIIPDFRGSIYSFSPFNMGLLYIASIMLQYDPFIHSFFRDFIMKGCCTLPNAFCVSIKMIMWFFCHWFYLCVTLCLLFCTYWTVFASLEWNPLDHSLWPFNMSLNLVWKYFVEDFYICVHQGYLSVVSILVVHFSSFGIKVKLAL